MFQNGLSNTAGYILLFSACSLQIFSWIAIIKLEKIDWKCSSWAILKSLKPLCFYASAFHGRFPFTNPTPAGKLAVRALFSCMQSLLAIWPGLSIKSFIHPILWWLCISSTWLWWRLTPFFITAMCALKKRRRQKAVIPHWEKYSFRFFAINIVFDRMFFGFHRNSCYSCGNVAVTVVL